MNNTKIGDFKRLIEAMGQGSEDAARELANLYTPHIIRAVRASLPRIIRTKFDSQDFAQAVWTSMLVKRGHLDQFEKPEQFIGYLAAMARNKVIDMHRHFVTQKNDVHSEVAISTLERNNYDQSTSPEAANKRLPRAKDPTPSQVAVGRETLDQLMDQSSDRDKEIISMRMEGMAYPAIAERLSVSDKTVQRALSRLHENIDP